MVQDSKSNKKYYFKDTLAYEMDKLYSLDIDDIIDFKLAELIKKNLKFLQFKNK